MLPGPLSGPHLIAVSWTQAVNTQHDSLGVESDGLRDIPTAQSAHVFSVGPGQWKDVREKKASQTHLTALPTGRRS